MNLACSFLCLALAAPSAALSGDVTACLQSRVTVTLLDIERDEFGSTLVYEASNDLDWPVSATYLRIAFDGPRRFVMRESAFPIAGAPLAAGETRVVRTKFWQTVPETVRAKDVQLVLKDVFDVDRRFLTGGGDGVHNWPNMQTKRGCRQ